MKRMIALLPLLVLIVSGLLQAQGPAAPTGQTLDRLPVRRVVLYKSGVGYFEHVGRVRGNQDVTIEFTSGQLDDVLKSLTVLDLSGGRVTNVGYNSEAGLDRRLGALRLPIGANASRTEFLSALRGARLEVRSGASKWTGRLLSVEQTDRQANGVTTSVDTLSLVSDDGDVRSIPLEAGVTVHIVDADLNQEVSRYLALVGSTRDQDVRRLTIATAGTGDRDVFVSYVSEVPVWKATYRLVLPPAGETQKPILQGWAIVDNTVGQDWTNVQLSLVAGAPQSFIQQVSRPYYLQRPVVGMPDRALLSPQTHQGAMTSSGTLTGTVRDKDGTVPGATVVVRKVATGESIGPTVTNQNGQYSFPGLAPGRYTVTISMNNYKTVEIATELNAGNTQTVTTKLEVGRREEVVNVVAGSDLVRTETPTVSQTVNANSIQTLPRNDRPGAGAGGRGGGDGFFSMSTPRLNAVEEATLRTAALQTNASGADLGDLFEYKLKEPVTIRKNQSALVPIAAGEVDAERVSLWTAGSGSSRPLRAVWLTNTTPLTLDSGSFSVIDAQAFAGEGLMDSLKPGERRLLSYAMDSGLTVDAKSSGAPSRVTRVQINRGTVIQESEDRQSVTYSVRNENAEARVLVIEHPVRTGWSLGGTVTPIETTPAWYRFKLAVAPKTTATIVVDEVRPALRQFLISTLTDDVITVLVKEQAISSTLETSLREVMTRKVEVARLTSDIASRQSELDATARDQQRLRENMQALKGSREERELLQRYVKQLGEQETRLETVKADLARLKAAQQKAQADLAAFIESLAG